MAAGNYSGSNGDVQGLVETLSGGKWRAGTSLGLGGLFSAITCASVDSCVATAQGFDGSGTGFIETLANGTWRAMGAPVLIGTAATDSDVGLVDLACPSVGACVAIGDGDGGLIEVMG